MSAAKDNQAAYPRSLRIFTSYVCLTMMFAIGVVFAFATKLQPHLVAISFGLALLGSIYCLSLGIYLWFSQRQDSSASSS